MALVVLGSSVSSIAVLSTIVVAPIAVALQAAAVAAGVLGAAGRVIDRKFTLKAEKHEKIKTLAEAKLNTISDYFSTALEDDNISDEEYSLILNERVNFTEMKEEIRSKVSKGEKAETITESFKDAFEKIDGT